MANFLITTPNSLTQGTDTQDLFDLRTGAGVSVVAAGGADLISAAATGFTAANLQAGAGNDTVTFSIASGVLDNAAILLGGGNDILTIASGAAAGTYSAGGGVDITGGGGNDSITILSGATFAGGSSVNGNQGSDTINILPDGYFLNSLIAGGGDNDFINVSTNLSGSTVNGGGGNDSITLNGAISNSRIEGDTLNDSQWFGNDTIRIIDGTFGSGSLLQGGQGNDLIVMSDIFTTGASIEGNAGTDSILIDAFVASGGTFVGGGAGNDTITVSATLLSNFGTIQGGGGNDSISVIGSGANSGFIFGGAGADMISLGTLIATGGAGASGINIGYAAFSESTLGSYDLVSANASTGAFMVNQSVVNFSVGSLNANSVTINSGFAAFTGTFSESLTARAALLDTTLGAGGSVVFEAGIDTFLFVQGGSTGGGNADDLIVQLGGGAANVGTGGIERISNTQLKVTFSNPE